MKRRVAWCKPTSLLSPSRWYLGWVWISGATDYYGGNWGFSKARAFLNTRVNFVTCTQ